MIDAFFGVTITLAVIGYSVLNFVALGHQLERVTCPHGYSMIPCGDCRREDRPPMPRARLDDPAVTNGDFLFRHLPLVAFAKWLRVEREPVVVIGKEAAAEFAKWRAESKR